MPRPRSTRTSPGCVPAGSSSSNSPVERRNRDCGAERRLRHREVDGREDVVALAHEPRRPAARGRGRRCRLPGRPARRRGPRPRCGSAGRRGSPAAPRPRAPAPRRRDPSPRHSSHGCSTIRPGAAALRGTPTCGRTRPKALSRPVDAARAAARRAGRTSVPGSTPSPSQRLARGVDRVAHLTGRPVRGLDELDLDLSRDVGAARAPPRRTPATPNRSSPKNAENRSDRLAEVERGPGRKPPSRSPA